MENLRRTIEGTNKSYFGKTDYLAEFTTSQKLLQKDNTYEPIVSQTMQNRLVKPDELEQTLTVINEVKSYDYLSDISQYEPLERELTCETYSSLDDKEERGIAEETTDISFHQEDREIQDRLAVEAEPKETVSEEEDVSIEDQQELLSDEQEYVLSDEAEETPLDDLINNYQNLIIAKRQNKIQPNSNGKNQEKILQDELDIIESSTDQMEGEFLIDSNKDGAESDTGTEPLDDLSTQSTNIEAVPTVEVISIQHFKEMRKLALELLYELFPFLSTNLIKCTAIENYWNIDSVILLLQMETQTQIKNGKINSKSIVNCIDYEVMVEFEPCVNYYKVSFPILAESDIVFILFQNDYDFEKTWEILAKVSSGDTDVLMPYLEKSPINNHYVHSCNGTTYDFFLINGQDEKQDMLALESEGSYEKAFQEEFEKLVELHLANDPPKPINFLQSLFASLDEENIFNIYQSRTLDDSFLELALKLQYPSTHIIVEEEVETTEKLIKTAPVEEVVEIPLNLQEIATWKDIFPQLTYLFIKKCWFKSNGDNDIMLELIHQHLDSLPNKSAKSFLNDLDDCEIEALELNKELILNNVFKKYDPEFRTVIKLLKTKTDSTIDKRRIPIKIMNKKVHYMKRFGALTSQFSEYCLDQNNLNIGLSLVNVIINYKKYEKQLKDHLLQLRQESSRKQSHNCSEELDFPLEPKVQIDKSNAFVKPSNVPFANKKISHAKLKSFLYILNKLPELMSINIEFSKTAFLYFNGNEVKTVALLVLFEKMKFIEDLNEATKNIKKTSISLEDKNKNNFEDDIDIPLKETIIKNISTISFVNTKKIIKRRVAVPRVYKYSTPEVQQIADDMLNNLLVNYQISLSGFTPLDAIHVILNAVKIWWEQELTERGKYSVELDGISLMRCNYVSNLQVLLCDDKTFNEEQLFIKRIISEYLKLQGYLVLANVNSCIIVGKMLNMSN